MIQALILDQIGREIRKPTESGPADRIIKHNFPPVMNILNGAKRPHVTGLTLPMGLAQVGKKARGLLLWVSESFLGG